MVADAVVLIGTVFILMIVMFGVGAYIISTLRDVAVDLFFGVPQIGDLSCQPPTIPAGQEQKQVGDTIYNNGIPVGTIQQKDIKNDDRPAFIFGKPGYNQLGCVHLTVITAGQIVVIGGMFFGIGMLGLKNITGESHLSEWIKFFGVSFATLVFISVFHIVHDVAAGADTMIATYFASVPHGPAKNADEMRMFAERSIMVPFDGMRNPFAIKHESITPVYVTQADGSRVLDHYDINWIGFLSLIFSPAFGQTLMVFTIGNMIGIMTTLVVFVAATIKFLLTGVLAVGFPLLFALSRLPIIGRHFQQWVDAYLGLMLAPILLSLVAMVAPIVAMSQLQLIHNSGHVGEDGESYVGFIFFVGIAYTYLAVIVGSAKFLGSVMGAVSTVVMGAAVTAVGSMMGTARGVGGQLIQSSYGTSAANAYMGAFNMASAHSGGMMSGMYGGSGHWSFARTAAEANAGAPGNELIENASHGSSLPSNRHDSEGFASEGESGGSGGAPF